MSSVSFSAASLSSRSEACLDISFSNVLASDRSACSCDLWPSPNTVSIGQCGGTRYGCASAYRPRGSCRLFRLLLARFAIGVCNRPGLAKACLNGSVKNLRNFCNSYWQLCAVFHSTCDVICLSPVCHLPIPSLSFAFHLSVVCLSLFCHLPTKVQLIRRRNWNPW